MSVPPQDIAVRRVADGVMPPGMAAQVDAIFFEASGRTFDTAQERAAFRERWLARYLQGGSDVVLVAQDRPGTVAGYLVGAMDDPAGQERFADIGYFRGPFRALCRRYPAHLHINLAPRFRNCGIGPRLIAAFAAAAQAADAPGMHVVTAREARNVRFYTRCGFAHAGAARWSGRDLVLLARSLDAAGNPPEPGEEFRSGSGPRA